MSASLVGSISLPSVAPGDVAVLTYTSGTTGNPKGAMNTHQAMVHGCCNFREWMGLTPGDSVLGLAPLFHITGLIGHVGLSLLLPCPLVLAHRFQQRDQGYAGAQRGKDVH